jgi:hypothetical protein
VKQQLERALPVTVTVENGLVPDTVAFRIMSRSQIEFVSGGALDILQITPGTTNAAEHDGNSYAGRAYLQYTLGNRWIVVSMLGAAEVGTRFPSDPTEVVASVVRIGHVIVRPEDMGEQYGFPYIDVEASSTQGGEGYELSKGDVLSISGRYMFQGFSFSARAGFTFGETEDTDILLTPSALDPTGELVGISANRLSLAYSYNGVVSTIQDVVTADKRATSVDTLVRAKPTQNLGVGPLVASGTVALDTVRTALDASIAELMAEGAEEWTLGDAMQVLAAYGLTATSETKLISYYQGMDRRRTLDLGTSVTLRKAWHQQVDTDLILIGS